MTAAVKDFEAYLVHNPTHMESLYLCAISYMHINQYSQAIAKLTEYLTLRQNTRRIIISNNLPTVSSAYLLLAIAFFKSDNLVKALEAVSQALWSNSKFVEGYCLRARIFAKMGETRKAYTDYASALKCDPHCLSATVGLGDYYSNTMGDYQTALKYY